MAIVPANPTQGQSLLAGTQAFLDHDDIADNKAGGVYSHRAEEFSATEAEQWCDFFRAVRDAINASSTVFNIKNTLGVMLPKATLLHPSSSDGTYYLAGLADNTDADLAPCLVLSEDTADGGVGQAYTCSIVSGLDTSAAGAVGDLVYLSPTIPGEYVFTAPAFPNRVHPVGIVFAKDPTVGVIGFILRTPWKGKLADLDDIDLAGLADNWMLKWNAAGTKWQAFAQLLYSQIQNVSATDKLLGRQTAGAGVIEEIPCTAAGRAILDDATASDQRTTLGAAASGLVTGSGLTASATDKVIGRVTAGAGALEEIACTAAGRAILDDVTAADQRTTLGAAASGLATGSGLTVSAADKLLGRVTAGAGAVEEVDCTAAGRAILDDANAAAQRVTLGLNRQAIRFGPNDFNGSVGEYAVRVTAASATGYFALKVPDHATSIVSCKIFGIPAGTNATADIDVYTMFAAVGEAYNANTGSDTTSTYSITVNQMFAIDLVAQGALSGLAAGDIVGIRVVHNALGAALQWTGGELVFGV